MEAEGMAREDRPAVVTHIHSGSGINRRGNDVAGTRSDVTMDLLEKTAIELADARCAATRAVVRETRVSFGFEGEVEIVPLGVEACGDFVAPPADGRVLFVGRLERLKGADVLARAANLFLRACPEATIEFVGPDTMTAPPGPNGSSMKQWMVGVIEEEVRGRVIFSGEIPAGEVGAKMLGSRFVVGPSLFENFSMVAAQAMALGRPVVCTEGIGTVEVIGESGLTFARGDASSLAAVMGRLWRDRELSERLGRMAWERAREKFLPGRVMEMRVGMYEKARRARVEERSVLLERAWVDPLMRLVHACCGVEVVVEEVSPGERLLRVMNRIAAQANVGGARVILYGAGRHSARLLAERNLWEKRGHSVVGFLDDAPRWAGGGEWMGMRVFSMEMLMRGLERGEKVLPVVLSTDAFEGQLWERTVGLWERGVVVMRLYT
jgi:hypothetical protein